MNLTSNMSNNDPIVLVLVCDNHLAIMLAALLSSIESSHSGDKLIHVYIIDDGISLKNINKINQTVTSKKIAIFWKTMKEVIPKHFQLPLDNSTYPLCVYVRLFIYYFLPPTIKKAIYMDVDMIVLKDIESLWQTDLNNYVIGAVTDLFKVVSSPRVGIKNYKELGIHPDTKYFNTGLLIFDLEKWREMNATQLILDTIRDNGDFVTHPDQYGFNVVFSNNWFELDSRWNTFAELSTKDPYSIHFTGIKPMFAGYVSNPDYRLAFYDQLKSTPWANSTIKKDYIWKMKQIRNMIRKKLWSTLAQKSLNFISKKVLFLNN